MELKQIETQNSYNLMANRNLLPIRENILDTDSVENRRPEENVAGMGEEEENGENISNEEEMPNFLHWENEIRYIQNHWISKDNVENLTLPSITSFNDVNENTDPNNLPLYLIVAHSNMEIYLKKNEDERLVVDNSSFIVNPKDQKKFIVNLAPPSTWGWLSDVSNYEEYIRSIKILDLLYSWTNGKSSEEIDNILETDDDYLPLVRSLYQCDNFFDLSKWIIYKIKQYESIIAKAKSNNNLFYKNYDQLLNGLMGKYSSKDIRDSVNKTGGRIEIEKLDTKGLRYDLELNKFICDRPNCYLHSFCSHAREKGSQIWTKNDLKKERGAASKAEILTCADKSNLPSFNSSYSIPGILSEEKKLEFFGTPILGIGYGIIKLIGINNLNVFDLVLKLKNTIKLLNNDNPLFLNNLKMNEINQVFQNVKKYGIISKLTHSNLKTILDNQFNESNYLFFLTNEYDSQGNQIINEYDKKMIELLYRSVNQVVDPLELYLEEEKNSKKKLSNKIKNYNKLKRKEKLAYYSRALESQYSRYIKQSELIKIYSEGIFVNLGCSVLDVLLHEEESNNYESLDHEFKRGTFELAYYKISDLLNNQNRERNILWDNYCDKIKSDLHYDPNIKLQVISYDPEDKYDFSVNRLGRSIELSNPKNQMRLKSETQSRQSRHYYQLDKPHLPLKTAVSKIKYKTAFTTKKKLSRFRDKTKRKDILWRKTVKKKPKGIHNVNQPILQSYSTPNLLSKDYPYQLSILPPQPPDPKSIFSKWKEIERKTMKKPIIKLSNHQPISIKKKWNSLNLPRKGVKINKRRT
jgi:hypothetical protein